MSQEMKVVVRPSLGGVESAATWEQEFAYLSSVQGWKLFATHYLGMEKSGHNVMFILVRDVPDKK